MKSSLLAIRSIGAEFANRIYAGVAILAGIVSLALIGLSVWLTTLSNWWWLLFMLILVAVSVVVGVLVVIKLVIKSITPAQTKSQKVQTRVFVDKLEHMSETIHTPKFLLLFRIVRDIAAPRREGFIGRISSDTSSLKKDFTAIAKSFEK